MKHWRIEAALGNAMVDCDEERKPQRFRGELPDWVQ